MESYDQRLEAVCRQITDIAAINPSNARQAFFRLPTDWQKELAHRLPLDISQRLGLDENLELRPNWSFPTKPIL